MNGTNYKCPTPIPHVDKQLAEEIRKKLGMPKGAKISATILRDLYETSTGNKLEIEKLVEDAVASHADMEQFYESDAYKKAFEQAVDVLAQHKADINRENRNAIKKINEATVQAMDNFKQNVSVSNQLDMIHHVLDCFFIKLNGLNSIGVDISNAINGKIDENGRKKYGEAYLFERVFDEMMIEFELATKYLSLLGEGAKGIDNFSDISTISSENIRLLNMAKRYIETICTPLMDNVYKDMERKDVSDKMTDREKLQKVIKLYGDMISNWPSVVMECRVRLSNTMGLKLSNTEDYGRQIEEGESSDNDMGEMVVAEESERERYQQVQNAISMWDRCNKIVKDILGRQEMKVSSGTGLVTVKTIFGTPKRISAKRAYNDLSENCFRYMQSEQEMMSRLETYARSHPTYIELYKLMLRDDNFRSLMFTSFYKGFQLYGQTKFETDEYGKTKVKTYIANKMKKLVNLSSRLSMNLGQNPNSIHKNGRINIENLKKLKDEIEFLFGKEAQNAMTEGFDFMSAFGLEGLAFENADDLESKKLAESQKVDEAINNHKYGVNDLSSDTDGLEKDGIYFKSAPQGRTREKRELCKNSLLNILNAIGYNVDMSVVEAIIKDKEAFVKLRRLLKDLAKYNLESQIKKARGSDGGPIPLFLSSSPKDGVPVKKIFSQLDEVVTIGIGAGNHESKASILGRHGKRVTVYSNVLPSFINRFVNTVQNFALSSLSDPRTFIFQSETRLKGIREWIHKNYLVSSQFSLKDAAGKPIKIYNRILRDLYENSNVFGISQKGLDDFHLSSQINLIEDAGTKDMRVEDFGSRDLMLEMISRFFGQMSTKSHKKTIYLDIAENATENQMKQIANDYINEHRISDKVLIVFNNTQYAFVADHETLKRTARPIAQYSTFNLGDSGKINFITLRTYGLKEILGITKEELFDKNADYAGMGTQFSNSEIYNLWCSELKRMHQVYGISQVGNGDIKIQSYSEKASTYTLLEYLNPIVEQKAKDKGIDMKDAKAMYNLATSLSVEEVAEATYKHFKDSFEQFKVDIAALGISSDKYFNEEMRVYAAARGAEMEKYMPDTQDFDDLCLDYLFNHKFNQMLQMQIFDIDKSFYKNVKDLQKRHKQVHANGAFVNARKNIGEGDRSRYRRVKYFKDLSVTAEELDQDFLEALIYNYATENNKDAAKQFIDAHKDDLKSVLFTPEVKALMTDKANGIDNYNMFVKYKKNSVTDGQAYISLNGYRRMHKLANTWTTAMEQAYQAIQAYHDKVALGTATENDLREISNLAVIFQPIKPFTYTIEHVDNLLQDEYGNKDVVLIPVQHKCAEVLIISDLLPEGSKLRELSKYMENEENDLDMMCSNEVVKVGYWGGADFNHADVSEIAGIMDGAVTHIIPFDDYRVQSNVPAHINQSRLFGTQLRKVLMGRIDMNKKYIGYFNPTQQIYISGKETKEGKDITGADVVKLYNSIITADILDSLEAFENIVLDNKKLSKRLQDSIMFNARNNKDALYAYALTGEEQFALPLFEGGVEHEVMAELLSIFRNNVTKQSMNGGSCVQAAPFDQDLQCHFDGNYNVTYIDCVVPFAEKYTDAFGKEVALKWEDYCDKDGNLLMYDANVSKIEHDFPGILDIIAYRIPTERAYSVMNLKVKRFSNPVMGGTIQVPSQFTTVAGFDFDVDKLFILRKSLIEESHTSEEWQEAYEKLKDFKVPGTLSDNGERTVSEVLGDAYNAHKPRKQKTNFGELIEAAFGHQVIEEIEGDQEEYSVQDAWIDSGLDKVEFVFNGVAMTFPTFHKFQKMFLNKGVMRSYDFSKSVYGQVEQIEIEEGDDEKTIKKKKAAIKRNNIIQHALRGNAIIDIAKARLSDQETFLSRFSPGNFETMREAAHMITALENEPSSVTENGQISMRKLHAAKNSEHEKMHDYTDPLAIVRINEQNQVAGKLIAMAANQNSNHIFAQLLSEFGLSSSIRMFGQDYKDMLHNRKEIANNVDRYVAEFLAASVDAVKDPVLNFLNLNPNTMNVAELMIRLGMTPLQMGLFLKQPIVMSICKDIVDNRVSIASAIANAKDSFRTKDNNDLKQLDDLFNRTMSSPGGNSYLNEESMATAILNETTGKVVDKEFQYCILKMFETLHNISVEMNTFVTSTRNTSSNAVRSTIGDMLSALERARQGNTYKYLEFSVRDFSGKEREKSIGLIDPNIKWNDFQTITKNKLKYIEEHSDNPFAYEQAMFDSIQRMLFCLGKHFPYLTDRYRYLRSALSSIMKYVPSGDMINRLHRSYPAFYLSTIGGNNPFNGDVIVNTIVDGKARDISQRDYYRYYFTRDFANMLSKYSDDPNIGILSNLIRIDTKDIELYYGDTKKAFSLPVVKLSELALEVEDKNTITSRIEEMYYHKDKEVREMAVKLFFYGYYNKGFEYSDESFLSLIPTRIKKGIKFMGGMSLTGYVQQLFTLLDNNAFFDRNNISKYITLFALNNLDEKSLAPTIEQKSLGKDKDSNVMFLSNDDEKSVIPTILTPNMKSVKTQRLLWDSKNDKDEKEFHCPPVLQVEMKDGNTLIYVLQHNEVTNDNDEESGFVFNEALSDMITYHFIGTKDELEFRGVDYSDYMNENNVIVPRRLGDKDFENAEDSTSVNTADDDTVSTSNEGQEFEQTSENYSYEHYMTPDDYKHTFFMMARMAGLTESESKELWGWEKDTISPAGQLLTDSYFERLIKVYKEGKVTCKDADGNDTHLC